MHSLIPLAEDSGFERPGTPPFVNQDASINRNAPARAADGKSIDARRLMEIALTSSGMLNMLRMVLGHDFESQDGHQHAYQQPMDNRKTYLV